jgi:peptidoglycan/xylan/chitin deacetylase (PgdA/CDA1 family)
MRDAGVDIQSHTYSHSNLRAPGTGVDAKTKALVQKDIQALGKEGWLRKEIIESRKVLEQRLGIKVNALPIHLASIQPKRARSSRKLATKLRSPFTDSDLATRARPINSGATQWKLRSHKSSRPRSK